MDQKETVKIRPARVTDAKAIKQLMAPFVEQGDLLPRPLSELYARVREFWVADDGNPGVVGCVALSVVWEDLAELRSLAVDANHRSGGTGRRLVVAALREARRLSLPKVFALTSIPGFFKKLGFVEVPMDDLPQKVFFDCIHCPKVDHCDEVALIFDTSQPLPESLLASEPEAGLQSLG